MVPAPLLVRVFPAATAQQGVATAEFFPHLILGGAAGVESRHTSDLFSQHNPSKPCRPISSRSTRHWAADGRRHDRDNPHIAAAHILTRLDRSVRLVIVLVVTLVTSMEFLTNYAVGVALPDIQGDLAASFD